MMDFIKPEVIDMKNHNELNEKWVQSIIAEDPGMLGLGALILKDKERSQPHAGRLDLLLQDEDSTRRYEVEIQLGKTDESHIIRTIEYWDIERKRYPQYEHCAVIIAEDITSRFLNVISLFNGHIPIVAIQMKAIQFGNKISLLFTTVLDQLKLGLVDDDEEVTEITDRAYWEKRATKSTVALTDEMLEMMHSFDTTLELKYNKFYIGLAKDGRANNFVSFKPQKTSVRIEMKLNNDEVLGNKLDEAGIDVLDYDSRKNCYKIRVRKGDIKKNTELLTEIFKEAYNKWNN